MGKRPDPIKDFIEDLIKKDIKQVKIIIKKLEKIKWDAKKTYGTLKKIKLYGKNVVIQDMLEDDIWKIRIYRKNCIDIRKPFSDDAIHAKSMPRRSAALHIEREFPPRSEAMRIIAANVGNFMWLEALDCIEENHDTIKQKLLA